MGTTGDMCIGDVEQPPGPPPAFLENRVIVFMLHGIFLSVHSKFHCHLDGFIEQRGAVLRLVTPIYSD